MTLSLAGRKASKSCATGAAVCRAMPVGARSQQRCACLMALNSYQQVGEQPDLLFAFEALPDSSAEALAFLCHWLNSAKPGGLLAGLRDRGSHSPESGAAVSIRRASLAAPQFTGRCTFSGDSRAVAGLAGLFRPARLERVEHEYASLLNASSTSAAPCNWPDWTANS
jgi:hypothetical protein